MLAHQRSSSHRQVSSGSQRSNNDSSLTSEVCEWNGFIPACYSRLASFSSPVTIHAFPFVLNVTLEEIQNKKKLEEMVLRELLYKHMPIPPSALLSASRKSGEIQRVSASVTEAALFPLSSSTSPALVSSSLSSSSLFPAVPTTMAKYAKRRREATPEREDDCEGCSKTTASTAVPEQRAYSGSISRPSARDLDSSTSFTSSSEARSASYYSVVDITDVQWELLPSATSLSPASKSIHKSSTETNCESAPDSTTMARVTTTSSVATIPDSTRIHHRNSNSSPSCSLLIKANLTLAQVKWGMAVGVAVEGPVSLSSSSSSHEELLRVSIQCTRSPPTGTLPDSALSSLEAPCTPVLTVLARLSSSEVAKEKQAVWVCCDAAGIFTLGVRVPRVARGTFFLKEGGDDGFTLVDHFEEIEENEKKNESKSAKSKEREKAS